MERFRRIVLVFILLSLLYLRIQFFVLFILLYYYKTKQNTNENMVAIAFKPRGYIKTDDKTNNATNVNTQLQKVCKTCKDNSTTNHSVKYVALKTTRHTDNLSQKMKQASFVRRTQENSIPQIDAINYRFRNL
jgi:hypothetical protein